MADIIPFTNRDNIRDQANRWVLRLEAALADEKPDEDMIESLLQWLDENHLHRIEFFAQARIWGDLDFLARFSDLVPLEELRIGLGDKPGRHARRIFSPALLAGSFCVVVSMLVVLATFGPDVDFRGHTAYVTSVGERDNISLDDGSSIKLNTSTRIEVGYTSEARHIYLTHGEAHFDVAHEPERAFVVHVGEGRITAVGTAFNVRYYDDLVGVTVTDGAVTVASSVGEGSESSAREPGREAAQVPPVSLTAGQTAQFDGLIRLVDNAGPRDVDNREMDRKLAWQHGMLIFNGDLLEDAVAEVARYTDVSIVIDDPAVREIQVGGYFRTGEVHSMLRAFESSFGIEVNWVDDGLVLLSRRPDSVIE